jgi:hypothetical protein
MQPGLKPISFAPEEGVNISEKAILENVMVNVARGLPQVCPHAANPRPALLVCGGPSLSQTLPELVDAHFRGGQIVTVNNAYNWALDHNLRPAATVMLDGREFNSRFVERDVSGCRYLLASQCHPRAFDNCEGRDVVIWHTLSGGEDELAFLREYYFERFHPVEIGTTVAIRAISLLRMLGFLRIEIFGLDSCWLDDRHHAYPQRENDRDQRIPITLRPASKDGQYRDDLARRFICAPWHVRQAEDFMRLTQERGNMLQLKVHGPGLIAAMIETGAQLDGGRDGCTKVDAL